MSPRPAIRRTVLFAIVLLLPIACGGGDSTGPNGQDGTTEQIAISPSAVQLDALGDSARLTATARNENGDEIADADVAWESLETAVATVSSAGWVVAQANGTAEVVARSGDATDTVTVDVQQVAAGLTVTPEAVTVSEGDTTRITATAVDANGAALDVDRITWTSANEAFAAVDAEGLVTGARAGGETVVTVRADDLREEVPVSVLDQIAYARGVALIYVMNADGSGATQVTNGPGDREPVWSPDGSKIAFRSTRDGDFEIYAMNTDGTGQTNLTNDPGVDAGQAWSPDGSRIAFESNRDGDYEIYVMDADGTGPVNLSSNPAIDRGADWSPDGSTIVFWSDRDGNYEVYTMDADGSNVMQLTNTSGDNQRPIWSPDGSKIAFISSRDGDEEVYVMNADGSSQVNISNAAGRDDQMVWSPDGTRIAFRSMRDGNEEVYTVDLDGTGLERLTDDSDYDSPAGWSPGGAHVLVHSNRDGGQYHFYLHGLDGGESTRITELPGVNSADYRPRP